MSCNTLCDKDKQVSVDVGDRRGVSPTKPGFRGKRQHISIPVKAKTWWCQGSGAFLQAVVQSNRYHIGFGRSLNPRFKPCIPEKKLLEGNWNNQNIMRRSVETSGFRRGAWKQLGMQRWERRNNLKKHRTDLVQDFKRTNIMWSKCGRRVSWSERFVEPHFTSRLENRNFVALVVSKSFEFGSRFKVNKTPGFLP